MMGHSSGARGWVVAVVGGVLALSGGCSSEDEKGGATGGTGGAGGIGGFGASSGGGGTGGGSGGTGGASCPPAPSDCETCETLEYMGCTCEASAEACFDDEDCDAIVNCVFSGDGSTGPCLELSEDGAACVHECIALYPAGKALYLAYENCGYCNYCKTSCDADEYCAALANPPDAGAGDAGTDASQASDAATD